MALVDFYRKKQHPSYYSTPRVEIFPLLPSVFSSVLELGCGDGSTLVALKNRNAGLKTVGIDINSDNLASLKDKGIDEVLIGNVETLSVPYERGSFDVILCLDVLEHLADPWSAVDLLAPLLKPGGVFIASIPNVQNIRVLLPLIFGRWEYKDCGILDQGHLRFFTRRSAAQLLDRPGLRPDKILHKMEPHWLPKLANVLTLNLLNRLVTVQFLIRSIRN